MRTRAKVITAIGGITAVIAMFASSAVAAPAHSAPARSAHKTSSTTHGHAINCGQDLFSCTEVYDSDKFFGHYVGHDEPSILYYSHKPGSGNRMTYQLQLPTDPASSNPQNKSYNFQLQVAFWVGMAMCDTQSYPEQLSTCRRDSDRNIVDPTVSPNHPGTAFMEMQFYPPGWVPFQFATSCSATQWCAALTIDSLGADPVSGQLNNSACLSTVGEETVNFAFITKNGHPQAPPNPVDSTLATFTPDPQRDLFMASGDKIGIKLHDTAHGLRVDLLDRTTGQRGHMVSSAANGFGQVKFDPNGTTCQNIPYDFHPMYSTSTPQTQVPWAAHTYNVAFDDEIGHFDHCTHVDSTTNTCAGMEGRRGHQEANDGDDFGCFSSAMSFLVKINGCLGTNTGFDGDSYLPLWPNGNLRQRPSPILISSPLTGRHYSTNYQKAGLEADLPAIESTDSGGTCDNSTGAGCTLIPQTDDGVPAAFYPFYTTGMTSGGCRWTIGTHVPGFSTRDFGGHSQYGHLLSSNFTNGSGFVSAFENFRKILPHNPCPAH